MFVIKFPFFVGIWLIVTYYIIIFNNSLSISLHLYMQVISLYNLSINEAKQELYYVMESMEIDLDKIINKSEQVLTEPHIKCLMKQLLEGLKAIHFLGINHRDIKPANLLVNQDCQLRITDFGLARFVGKGSPDHDHLNESVTPMTEYVVTRWYRAPEILLAPGSAYSDAIDIWSAGCVCAEMFLRKPLFPGEGYIDQVQLIFKVIGLQDLDDLGFTVSDSVSNFLKYRCLSLGESYSSLLPGTSEESLQFLEAMLTVNPFSRPSASLALTFPFVSDAEVLFDYKQLESVPPPLDYFSFEYSNLDSNELAELIRHDVERFNDDPLHSPEAVVSEHSNTSRDSDVTNEEGYSTETESQSPTPIDEIERHEQLVEHDCIEKSRNLRKLSGSSWNPFGKHNSNAKRLDRQNSFARTSVDSSFILDSTLKDGEFEYERDTKSEASLMSEDANITSFSVGAAALQSSHPHVPVITTVSEIAPIINMNRQMDGRMHSKRVNPITKRLGESTVLKPVDNKQCKFSQSKGFPLAGFSNESSLAASNRLCRSVSAKFGRATISVFSDLLTAPLQMPPLLSNSVSLNILGEEGSITTQTTSLRDRQRHRTQRFSIVDIDMQQKAALSDLLLQRPSRNRVSSIQGTIKSARSNSQS